MRRLRGGMLGLGCRGRVLGNVGEIWSWWEGGCVLMLVVLVVIRVL